VTFPDGGPSIKDVSVSSEDAQSDPFSVYQVANLVEPTVRENPEAIVARPIDLVRGIRRLRYVDVDPPKPSADMEAAVRSSANPFGQGDDVSAKCC